MADKHLGYRERHQDSEHRDPVKIEESPCQQTDPALLPGRSGQSAHGGRTLRYARPAPQAIRARLPHRTADLARWAPGSANHES